MNTKNLDAIKRMVTRLQAIRETEFLYIPVNMALGSAVDTLKEVIAVYDKSEQEDDSVR